MRFVPRPYQEAGIDLMLREPGCGLFMEPGSGKTVTSLTAADLLLNDQMSVQKVLVIAPKMVAQEVWHRECSKWDHLRHLSVYRIDAGVFDYYRKTTASAVLGREAREIVENTMSLDDQDFLFCADVVVRRHEILPRDWRKTKDEILRRGELIHVISRDHLYNLIKLLGDDWPYDLVIGDESTTWKNYDSKRSVAMHYLRERDRVSRFSLMSGTPSPKGLENLFSQMLIIDGGERLGNQITRFRRQFLLPGASNGRHVFNWTPKPGAQEQVTRLISDVCLAVRADAWRETDPPRTVQRIVQLPDDVMDQYRRLEEDYHLVVNREGVSAANAAVLQNKLIQVASGILFDNERQVHELHDAKLEALDELIEELDGEPLLVVYWFQPTLARLKRRYGAKLATTKTKGFLDRFARGELPLLAVQPGGAGHGLDGLQNGGHHVAVVDLFHDWELYQQVISRLDRSGQKHQVSVHVLLAAGTKDRRVAKVLADRGASQAEVMIALQ